MSGQEVTYSKDPLGAAVVQQFFRRNRWSDFYTIDQLESYLARALLVASAWRSGELVGLAVLSGDGRAVVELSDVCVDRELRRRGIGTRLMKIALEEIERLNPCTVKVEVFEERTQRFYERFGFRRNAGTWLLEYGPAAERVRERVREVRGD